MKPCPRCGTNLVPQRTQFGLIHICPRCKGRCVALPVLRNSGASNGFLRNLWQRTVEPDANRVRHCPFCGKKMVESTPWWQGHSITLDTCRLCTSVWFDTKEYERLPHIVPPAKPVGAEKELSQKSREAVALSNLKRLEERANNPTANEPPEGWQWLPALLGLPVECDAPQASSLPIITWAVILISFVASLPVFLGTAEQAEIYVNNWGFIPSQWGRYGGITLITGFFIHGGWLHLAGNMYFLSIFGDNVEDHVKRWLYLALILGGHILGSALHGLLDANVNIPLIGASAGISGVLAYYALAYPKVNIGFFWRFYLVYFRFFRVTAVTWLILYILLQILGIFMQLNGLSNVSALGHFGGIIAGLSMGAMIYIRKATAKASPVLATLRQEKAKA